MDANWTVTIKTEQIEEDVSELTSEAMLEGTRVKCEEAEHGFINLGDFIDDSARKASYSSNNTPKTVISSEVEFMFDAELVKEEHDDNSPSPKENRTKRARNVSSRSKPKRIERKQIAKEKFNKKKQNKKKALIPSKQKEKQLNDRKSFECYLCEYTSKLFANLCRHMALHLKRKESACDICGQKYKHLILHRKRVHAPGHFVHRNWKAFACDQCDQKYSNKDSLTHHRGLAHGHIVERKPKPLATTECDCGCKSSSTPHQGRDVDSLVANVESSTSSKETQGANSDSKNNKSQSEKQVLAKLEKKDGTRKQFGRRKLNNKRSYECYLCEHTTKKSCNLRRHMSHHVTREKFTCNQCDTKYKDKSYLTKHRVRFHGHIVHKPEKHVSFACDQCEWTFKKKSGLVSHQKIHIKGSDGTVIKPFTCDVCQRAFLRKDNLEEHKRVHTGEKPFSCDVCKKRFSHQASLNTHKLSHTGDGRFGCDYCSSMFYYKSHLDRHLRIHTGEKPYSCDKCDQKYSYRGSLSYHKKIHLRKEALEN